MKAETLIVGAGFAGAATAYHLSRSSDESIVIAEAEARPGSHASGRNAALVLQSVADSKIRRLIADSRTAYARRRDRLGFRQSGSLLIGCRRSLETVREPDRVDSEWIDPGLVRKRIPLLDGHSFDRALLTRGDGVMDLSRLLDFYLAESSLSGVQVRLDSAVQEIKGRGPFRVRTASGSIEAQRIVNAAGAWSEELSRMAGATQISFRSLKRHLVQLGDLAAIDSSWPFVWDLEADFYFRPRKGGLLFCLCEELESESLVETVDTRFTQGLASATEERFPALSGASIDGVHACFRTHSPDGLPVIGPDPGLPSFYWAAGLGGIGMGASWEIGRLTASTLLEREEEGALPLAAARFAKVRR